MTLNAAARVIFDQIKAPSETGLAAMRDIAIGIIANDDPLIVGVSGSYARREVTTGSDVNLFALLRKGALNEASEFQRRLRATPGQRGFKMPASDGVFGSLFAINVVTQKIGGMDDFNDTVARRKLLLLKGEWIYGEAGFDGTRDRLLNQCAADAIRPDRLALTAVASTDDEPESSG